MSSARAVLIFIAVCLAVPSTTAQPQRRGKPPAKTAEAEAKDSSKQAAELYEAGQSAHQKGELEKAVEL
jgi:outer membrane protein assembly factor BamD (BamD/ComL family)